MNRARRLGNHATAIVLLLFLLVVSGSRPAGSQSFDCEKAATAIERTICGNTQLRQLDSELAHNYRAAMKHIAPEDLKSLVATQRDWVSDRNSQCAAGAAACLFGKYRERNDLLTALLARTSDDNPMIDRADPAALLGAWVVVAGEDPDGTPPGKLVPVAANLPPAGARLIATPGELCVVEPPEAKICNSFGLAVEQSSLHTQEILRSGKGFARDCVVLLTYFDGRADFELVAGPNQELAAVFHACEPSLKNCRWVTRPWRAASPDAAVKIYHLFY